MNEGGGRAGGIENDLMDSAATCFCVVHLCQKLDCVADADFGAVVDLCLGEHMGFQKIERQRVHGPAQHRDIVDVLVLIGIAPKGSIGGLRLGIGWNGKRAIVHLRDLVAGIEAEGKNRIGDTLGTACGEIDDDPEAAGRSAYLTCVVLQDKVAIGARAFGARGGPGLDCEGIADAWMALDIETHLGQHPGLTGEAEDFCCGGKQGGMGGGGVLKESPVGGRGEAEFGIDLEETDRDRLGVDFYFHSRHAKITLMRFAALILAALVVQAQGDDPKIDAPLRVLFLGNSYTYYNALPDMVMQVANSTPGRRIEAKSVTRGGATLADLWSLTNALDVLRAGTWDYVVLQDQSTLGTNYADGKWNVNEAAGLLRWVRFWNAEIQRKNAKPLLYLTWARKTHAEFQTALNYAYSESARDINGTIAPAGLAWRRVREASPQIELFDADGSHPAPLGTYLTACVFVETLVGRSCENATRNVGSLRVSPGDQHVFSEAAHYAVEQYKAGILTNLPKPEYGALRPLQNTGPTKPEDFSGIWKGSAMLYNDLHEMELNVVVTGRRCRGTMTQTRGQVKLSYPLSACAIDTGTMVFLTSDPRVLVEEYKAVINEGRMTGTHVLRTTDPYMRMLGSFDLRKD